ncbi:porin family protein [Melioribacteraceae bacterium 4301-Me]|uniref:porin family protein n=1 Tax=Pyranulibacter aquaticus TaxID=3163344 RepID=UPI00359B26D9
MNKCKNKFLAAFAILALFILFQTQAYSQAIMLGVKGGISIPELKGGGTPQSEGYSSRLAPNFGAFINYLLNTYFSLQAEVLFSGQGGKRNGMQAISNIPNLPVPPNTNLYANFDNETILNYLEIPVMVKYLISGSNTGASAYIDAGPYFGILLNAKTQTSGNSKIYLDQAGTMPISFNGYPIPPQSFDNETNITSDIKTLNVGITGGIGITLNTTAGEFDIDLRGVYGFIPIQSDKTNGSNNTGALYLTIGYGFKI